MRKQLFLFLLLFICSLASTYAITVSDGVLFVAQNNSFIVSHDYTQTTDTIIISESQIIVNAINYSKTSSCTINLFVTDYVQYKYFANSSCNAQQTINIKNTGRRYALFDNTYYNYTVSGSWLLPFTALKTRLWLTDGGNFNGMSCPSTTPEVLFYLALLFGSLALIVTFIAIQQPIMGIFACLFQYVLTWSFSSCSGLLATLIFACATGFLLFFMFTPVRQSPS